MSAVLTDAMAPEFFKPAAAAAFLAPDLVKAAIDGTLPHGMGVVRLADLPGRMVPAAPDAWPSLELRGISNRGSAN
jgi:hypothetical protein